jgi:hypothetical protein
MQQIESGSGVVPKLPSTKFWIEVFISIEHPPLKIVRLFITWVMVVPTIEMASSTLLRAEAHLIADHLPRLGHRRAGGVHDAAAPWTWVAGQFTPTLHPGA